MKGKDILQLAEFLMWAEPAIQVSVLKSANDEFIQFIGETALNILEEVIPLSKHFKSKLQPHAEVIRSLGTRRRLCVKQSELVALMLRAAHSELLERFS